MQTQTSAAVVRLDDYRNIKPNPPARKRAGKRTSKPVAERLAAKVDTSGGLFECHPYTGSVMQANGYGQIHEISPETGKRTTRTAHAVAWESANGRRVPKGLIVLHNLGCLKTCCNPAHLRIGTHAENALDRVAEGTAGRRLGKAKVLEIVRLHMEQGLSASQLARRFGCDPSTTRRILRGERWAKVTGIERTRGKPGTQKRQSSTLKPNASTRTPVHADALVMAAV